MMMMMMQQLKRCWVPEGIYFWLQRKWENIWSEKDRENFAPTKEERVMAGKFPLPLLILTLPGTKLPWEAAVLPWPMMGPDSLVLPCSEPGGGHLFPSPISGHHVGSQVGRSSWAHNVSWYWRDISWVWQGNRRGQQASWSNSFLTTPAGQEGAPSHWRYSRRSWVRKYMVRWERALPQWVGKGTKMTHKVRFRNLWITSLPAGKRERQPLTEAKIRTKYQFQIHTDRALHLSFASSQLWDLRNALISESSSFLYKIAKRTTWWKRAKAITDVGCIVDIQEKAMITIIKNMRLNATRFRILCLSPWTPNLFPFFFFIHSPFSEEPGWKNYDSDDHDTS